MSRTVTYPFPAAVASASCVESDIRPVEWSAALTRDEIEAAGMHIEDIVSFIRKYQNEEILVLNAADAEITLQLQDNTARFSEVAFDTAVGTLSADDGEITLPPYTTAILK